MGILEEEGKRRRRNNSIKMILFTSLAIAGVMALGGGAGFAINILRGIKNPKKHITPNAIRQAIFQLKREGKIISAETPRGRFIRLTPEGKRYFEWLQSEAGLRRKPKRWDKKWRVVIFDINEKKRHLRRRFRLLIQSFGFYRLQDSVWVYPYDCEDFLVLAKAELKIGREILYLIVEMLEGDDKLKEYFQLDS